LKALEFDEVNQKIVNKVKRTIDWANSAPRCQYPKGIGELCRAPRVRGRKYCHLHLMLEEALSGEDQAAEPGGCVWYPWRAGGVDGKLDYTQASILGYYLQLALSNVGKVDVQESVIAE
jgi:hypothetical protein